MFGSEILFNGYYGQKNIGDDAFVEASKWGATEYWKKHDVRYLAKNKDLPICLSSVNGYPLSIPGTYKYQQAFMMNSADYIISAGGSTFYDAGHGTIKYSILKNKGKRTKIGAIGVSVGPFKNLAEERSLNNYLSKMSFLCVRDQRSFDYVNSLALPYKPVNAFDLAALLPRIYSKRINQLEKSNKKIIGLSLCNYESYIKDGDLKNEDRRNSFIEQVIRKLNQSEDYCFRFYIFNGNEKVGDYNLTKTIVSKIPNLDYEIVDYSRETEKTFQSIRECDVMLSTRLHASIFACFAEVPFFLIEYHKKCSDFLTDIGQGEMYRVLDAEISSDKLCYSVMDIIEGKNYLPPKNVKLMIDKAELNFSAINI